LLLKEKVPPFLYNLVQNGPLFKEFVQEKDKGGPPQSRGVGLLSGGKIPLFWHNLVQNETSFGGGEVLFHRSSLRIRHLLPNHNRYCISPVDPKSCFCLARTTPISLIIQLTSRKCRYSINRTYYYATASL
jgi:hypothetical protein